MPNKDDYYSILNNEHVSVMQYVQSIKVGNTFKFRNMVEYHDLYLKSDILLLADVFEILERLECNIMS